MDITKTEDNTEITIDHDRVRNSDDKSEEVDDEDW